MVDVAHVQLHDEAVLAGHALALGDLRRVRGDLRELGQLPGVGAHSQDRAQVVAERAGVQLGAVAEDHAVRLQPPHPLGHRRGRQSNPPAQLGQAHASIGL